AVLGDESALRERCCEHGTLRCETEVAHRRDGGRHSGARPVDRRDYRLLQRRYEAPCDAELRVHLAVPALRLKLCQALVLLDAPPLRDLREAAHVRAGAERPAGARQDDANDALVALRRDHRVLELDLCPRRQGVEPLRPVDRDCRDRVFNHIDNLFVHCCAPTRFVCRIVQDGSESGTLIPLPGVPTNVERGGGWTLQRLQLETSIVPLSDSAGRASAAGGGASEILKTRIDALDITVLEGGGPDVAVWAEEHGFRLSPDAPGVLDFYAARSPIFLAALFDGAAAA